FVPRSPYVLAAPEILKPMPVEPAAWSRLYDRLLNITRSSVGEELKAHPSGADVDFAAHRDAAAAVVMNKVVNRLPTTSWAGDDKSLLDAYRALITSEIINDALTDRLARFEIRGMM